LNVPEELSAQVPTESTWLELDKVREELGLTVVCLYDMSVLSPGFLLRMLSSFPQVIMDGVLCRNFYYVPSLSSPQRVSYRDLYEQLESIREERDLRQSEGRERLKLMELNRELQEEMLQRRMVEFALLRAENNLRTMLDAMPEMVFMVDRDLRVTLGNQTFIRHLEATGVDTSYEGRFVYDLFPGATTEGRKLFEEVFRYGYPTVVQDSLATRSGRQNLEARLVPVMMGDKVDRVVAIARPMQATAGDMKEMWDRAEVLKEEVLDPEGPSAGAMEHCPHPVLVTDNDGKVLYTNQALGRELGCSPAEVMEMGSAYRFLSPHRDANGAIRRISIDGRITIPSILTRKDGSRQDVICYVVYISNGDDGKVLTVMTSGP
jgi:PAS domain S-box-containing protein